MTDKLEDVWTSRDFPVLVEVTRRIDAGENAPFASAVAEAVGLSEEDLQLAAAALVRRGLVTVHGALGVTVVRFNDVSAEAYFLTGLHPSGDDAVSGFVDALRQAADLTADPEEKSRLRGLADAALGVGRQVLGGVLINLVSRGIPG